MLNALISFFTFSILDMQPDQHEDSGAPPAADCAAPGPRVCAGGGHPPRRRLVKGQDLGRTDIYDKHMIVLRYLKIGLLLLQTEFSRRIRRRHVT